jgi:multisubunit Na+/H+ antiporter MnhG subunit
LNSAGDSFYFEQIGRGTMFGKIFGSIAKLIGLMLKLLGKGIFLLFALLFALIFKMLLNLVQDFLMTDASVKRRRQSERDELRRLRLMKARRDAYDE